MRLGRAARILVALPVVYGEAVVPHVAAHQPPTEPGAVGLAQPRGLSGDFVRQPPAPPEVLRGRTCLLARTSPAVDCQDHWPPSTQPLTPTKGIAEVR